MILEKKTLKEAFDKAKLDLTDEQADSLCGYAQMLVEKNKVMNLTAITDPEGIAVKHFVDSVLPLKLYDIKSNAKIIDVGTGAGFPSVPMCIIRPDLQPTLIDSLNKRVNFLNEVCREYVPGAEVIHIRAEDGARQKELREGFDVVTARAVAGLNVLCEYCLPYAKIGGVFLALKGPDASEELKAADNALQILGAKVKEQITYTLPNGEKRTLIVIQKIKNTPGKYPRVGVKIAKQPL